MKLKFFILFILGVLFLHENLLAQCTNRIDVSSTVDENSQNGIISVQVSSNEEFSIKLLIESAEGDTVVKEENHSGNSTIEFSDLSTGVLYTVTVQFSDSQDFICRSLRKTVFLTP